MIVVVNNPNTVLWLQQALARAIFGPTRIEPSGQYDSLTRKAVMVYQSQNKLPVTGDADAATVQKIEQDLVVLDASPFKKKQRVP